MADQPQTRLSEVITSTTEEKKTEPSPEQNIQAASEPKKEENNSVEPAKKLEASEENKEKSI